MTADLYGLLGVEPDADATTIKRAFRKKAAKLHPDRGGDEAAFKEVANAYEVLSDESRRAHYDRFGEDPGSNGRGAGAGDPLGDMFRMFFGDGFGGTTRPRRGAPDRGRDVAVGIEVSLEDVATGTRLDLTVDMPIVCETCTGSGSSSGDTSRSRCRTCQGAGRVTQVARTMFANVQTQTICPDCEGAGTTIDDPCSDCGGNGRRNGTRTVAVDVPAGIEDRAQIRVRGAGEAGRHGSAAGDLIVEVNVAEHEVFVRDRQDLWAALHVSSELAIVGTDTDIEDLLGDQHVVTIPAGTQHDDVIEVSGAGMPSMSERPPGDLRLRVKLVTPTDLDDEELALIADAASKRHERLKHPRRSWFGRLRDLRR